MKVFMLDLSKCEEPQSDGYDKPIPCKLGEFELGLDVIKDRIDPVLLGTWQKKAREKLETQGLIVLEGGVLIGFSLGTIPVGAVITIVEEEE